VPVYRFAALVLVTSDVSTRNSCRDSARYFTSAGDGTPRLTSAFAQAWRILACTSPKIRFAWLKQLLPRNSDGGDLPGGDVMLVVHRDS